MQALTQCCCGISLGLGVYLIALVWFVQGTHLLATSIPATQLNQTARTEEERLGQYSTIHQASLGGTLTLMRYQNTIQLSPLLVELLFYPCSLVLILVVVSEVKGLINKVLVHGFAYLLSLIFAAKLALIFGTETNQLMPISKLVSEAGKELEN